MLLLIRHFTCLALSLAVTVGGLLHCAHAVAGSPAQQNYVTHPNPLAQAAQAAGVVKCVPRINRMTDFLLANSQGGAHTFFPPQHADQSLLSTSFEVITGDVSSYASASFAPVGGGCGAVYEAVSYWQNSCDEVAGKVFPQMKRTGLLKQRVQVLEAGATARVFLLPAGTGCMSIKKEVLY
jgi:hypothetical protein